MNNGIFNSLTIRDLLHPSNRDLTEKVAEIWNRHVAPDRDYLNRNNVIIEDLGRWLKQSDWTDETGFFIKFRLHPSFCHLERVQDAGRAVFKAFLELFPNRKNTYVENASALDGGVDTITLVVETASYSVGD